MGVSMNSLAIVAYLEANHGAFKTGSAAWGVQSEESDIDMVVPLERINLNDFKALIKEWNWSLYTGVTSNHGYKLHAQSGDDRDIDLILVSADRFNRWRLATTIVDALVLSSPVFKEAIKTKHLRVGFFEGLRALLHLIGV